MQKQDNGLAKSPVETALDFAHVSLDSAERMLRLQLQAAKDFLAEQGQAAKAISAENIQAAEALRKQLAEQAVDRVLDYSRGVCDATTAMQKQLTGLIEAHYAAYQKELTATMEKVAKSTPGCNAASVEAMRASISVTQAAMDNMTRTAKQIASLADMNIKAVTQAAETALKGNKKK